MTIGVAVLIDREGTVLAMTTPHPHSATDLALAPVLLSIERNLSHLRECEDLEYEFALRLNDDDRWYHTPADRAGRVAQMATRDLALHGWDVRPTPDLHGLAVEHGEYRVSLMFGARLTEYIAQGTAAAYFEDGGSAPRR